MLDIRVDTVMLQHGMSASLIVGDRAGCEFREANIHTFRGTRSRCVDVIRGHQMCSLRRGYQLMSNLNAQSDLPSQPGRLDKLLTSSSLERAFDLAGATTLVIFLAPLLALVAFFVHLQDGGRAFFVQRRIGRDGQPFELFKFRTMCVDAEERLQELLRRSPEARAEWALDQKLRDDPRITPVGRFLRQFSLDELPQLFNVIRGEMSLVGPRPIVEAEIVRYGEHFEQYCEVRPGITGLWQVSGRNDVSYGARVALDVAYVRQRTVVLDMRIILLTLPALISKRGAY